MFDIYCNFWLNKVYGIMLIKCLDLKFNVGTWFRILRMIIGTYEKWEIGQYVLDWNFGEIALIM